MKPVSLADITYEQGLQLLALRKQAMDEGRIRRMTPEALANTMPLRDVGHSFAEKVAEGGWLDSLKSGIGQLGQRAQQGLGQAQNYFQTLDPASRNTLLSGLAGTGLGAAAGLGQAVMSGDDNYLTSALRGGVAGGALGGGLGLAFNPEVAEKLYGRGKAMVDSLRQRKSPDAQTPEAPPRAEAASAGLPSADKIRQLTEEAGSSRPEAAAAILGGGTAAGTAAGVRYGLNRPAYDPNRLADELYANAGSVTDSAEHAGRRAAYGKLLAGDLADTSMAADVAGKTVRTEVPPAPAPGPTPAPAPGPTPAPAPSSAGLRPGDMAHANDPSAATRQGAPQGGNYGRIQSIDPDAGTAVVRFGKNNKEVVIPLEHLTPKTSTPTSGPTSGPTAGPTPTPEAPKPTYTSEFVRPTQQEVREALLAQRGNRPNWLKTLFGGHGASDELLQDAATALGRNQDEVLKLITNRGMRDVTGRLRSSRAILPAMVLGGGSMLGKKIYDSYQANVAERDEAAQQLREALQQTLRLQTNQ